MIFAVSAVSASAADTDVAAIGEATYETLTAALNNSVAGDTITLLDDVTENVTISKNITLDGADKQYTGKITITDGTVTIQNVQFVNSQVYRGKVNAKTGTLTVKNCSFEGKIANDQYAINAGYRNKLVVENCDAKDVGFGFIYVPSEIDNVVVKNVNIDGATYGVTIVYGSVASFENVTIKNAYVGIMNQTYAAKTFTLTNCTVDAEYPVAIWERKATVQTFIFKGKNDLGTDDYTFGSSYVKSVFDVAKLGDVVYTSLQAAIDACVEGDNNITLLRDCAETVTIKQQAGINIVVDGNGKTYSGTIKVDGNKRFSGAETLTIKNVKFENTTSTDYARFIDAEVNASGANSEAHNLTVEDCSFKSNNWHYVLYSRNPRNVIFKNCTAEKVYYFIYNPQGGQTMTIEDCTVTGATYGVGSQKCTDVSIKNYTYTGKAAGIYGRATSNDSSITMENIDITTTLAGQPAITLWKNNDGNTSKTFKFIFKGKTKITAPEGVAWFARQSETNSPYVMEAKCDVDTSSNVFGYAHTASEAVTENNVDPDCLNDGSYDTVVYCSVCNDELSRETIIVDALGHTAGAAATCQAAQVCTVCGVELDPIKAHTYKDYVSNNDATCQEDGTKTASCIYDCGKTDTLVDEGTMKDHEDRNNNGDCDYCAGELCTLCGELHETMRANWICLLIELIRLFVSFISIFF